MLYLRLPRNTRYHAQRHLTIAGLALVLAVTGCGSEADVRPTATSPASAPSTVTVSPTQEGADDASPTVDLPATQPLAVEPQPEAGNATEALANLERAIARPGYVYHATLAQVNTDSIGEPELITPVWSADVWIDIERDLSRADYQLEPGYSDPMVFSQPGYLPPAPNTIHVGEQVYRAYDGQVWVSLSDPCLGMDQPVVAVAFVCDLATDKWFSDSAFVQGDEDSELFLQHDVDFESQPAVALSVGEHAMAYLFLDAETYLPLGWTMNMMESGTRVTTFVNDFIPIDAIATDLLDPSSIGYQPGPAPSGRILIRRDIITVDVSTPEIFIVNLDGSGEMNLSNNPGMDLGAVWSPDGERVAFGSERDGNHDIYVINADGSGLTNLTNSETGESGPVWSPDGTRILFESDRDGTNLSELYVMDLDGENVIRLSPPDIPGNAMWPAWSPDGARVAFASEAGVHVVNADGTDAAQITSGASAFVNWTPDGDRLVFSSFQGGGSDIFAVNSDGSDLQNLTDHPADDSWPILSPDGERILFNSDRDGISRDAYLMNIDGSQPAPLTFPPSTSTCDTGCGWSPDGASIVVTLHDQIGMSYPLAIVSTDSSTVIVLPGVDGFTPQWAPDAGTTP
jgi:Tol biopolymer transport system component